MGGEGGGGGGGGRGGGGRGLEFVEDAEPRTNGRRHSEVDTRSEGGIRGGADLADMEEEMESLRSLLRSSNKKRLDMEDEMRRIESEVREKED